MTRRASAALLLLLIGCSQPDYEGVKRQFVAESPGCSVVSADPGEGDSDNIYVIIKYTCGTSALREAEWLYQRRGKRWERALIVRTESTRSPKDLTRGEVPSALTHEPMQVGGEVTVPIAIKRVEPKWPEGVTEQTMFLFEATITKNGDVADLRLLKGEDGAHAEAAKEAIQQWRFKPGTYRGQPVDVRYNVTLTINVR